VTRRLISIVAGDSDAGARTDHARERLAALSQRERDVALAVGLGHANAEIAAMLHLSVATVKGHVSRLLDKLEVDNRVQIALLVQAAGEHQGYAARRSISYRVDPGHQATSAPAHARTERTTAQPRARARISAGARLHLAGSCQVRSALSFALFLFDHASH